MSLALFAHPFSSYCQKVLIALYQNDTPFEYRVLSPDDPAIAAEHAGLWPLGRMPVLVDSGRTVVESWPASSVRAPMPMPHVIRPRGGARASRESASRSRSSPACSSARRGSRSA